MDTNRTGPEAAGRAIEATEDELRRGFPAVAPEVIHDLVDRAYTRLTPARIQGFLPILIVRDVRMHLHTAA